MQRNHQQTYVSDDKNTASEKLKAAVDKLVKGRADFKGGGWVAHPTSCRLALPESTTAGADVDDGAAACAPSSKKRKAPPGEVTETVGGGKSMALGGGGGGGGSGGNAPTSPAPSAESILGMSQSALHEAFPFTSTLQFDAQKLWNDANHKALSNECKRAGKNVFGHSVIVGHNPKTGGLNFWVCGTQGGVIIPYNLKLKLRMTLSGRDNHQSTGEEKARVAAMYRECELRGIGFQRPT